MQMLTPAEITAVPVADLIARASAGPMFDPGEQARLERSVTDDGRARIALVHGHLRVAVDEAIRCRGLGRPQEHLVRAAAIALVEAAAAFDPNAHGSFERHARLAIRRAIDQAMAS